VAKADVNAQPVLVLGVRFARAPAGKSPDVVLRAITDATERRVKPQLRRVEGVASVRVIGGWNQEVAVQAEPGRLLQYGLSVIDLLAPMRAASLSVAAGALKETRRRDAVRVEGEFRSLAEIQRVPIYPRDAIGTMGGPAPIGGAGVGRLPAPPTSVLLSDVARVRLQTAEPEQLAHVGGEPGVVVQVIRLGEAHTVQVVGRVKAVLRALEQRTPAGEEPLSIQVLQDQSAGSRLALDDINGALLLGCLFAVLVVFVFLHSLRDTLIVAMQLPSSIICTFGVMWLAGFTLNQMPAAGRPGEPDRHPAGRDARVPR
jgi:HAE1 family hydrophobic/amphiphilic exporter-1